LVGIFHQPYHCDFDILYEYTEYHILLSQKISVWVSAERRQDMKNVWDRLRHDILGLKPHHPIKKAQVNLSRTLMTGVADMICQNAADENGDQPIVLYEIKTCSNADWKDEAFTQAALYMSMTKNKRGVIRLLNPFRRELHEYNISLLSKEKQVMTQTDRELLLWNFNCFLAKFQDNVLMPALPHNIQQYVCGQDGVYLEFLASTKARLVDTIINKTTKIVLPFDKNNIILSGKADREDLTGWLMDAVDYKKQETPTKTLTDMVEDPFYQCVLMGVYLRKSFSFR
jgi:hypothetical protein